MTQQLTLLVEGLSEEQVREDIRRNTQGFRLFFLAPKNADYEFANPFWGFQWKDYDADALKKVTLRMCDNRDNTYRHYIIDFVLNGISRFGYCSWTWQLYDAKTKQFHKLEPPLAKAITEKISNLMSNE